MGRNPCCSKEGLNRGAWTAMEDKILSEYINLHGEGKWRNLPKRAGLKRCGKSCRLRWLNYLRPDIKRGNITLDEEELIIRLHNLLGNRWSLIAGRLPGRTDNEIKNYWNTNIVKRIQSFSHPKTTCRMRSPNNKVTDHMTQSEPSILAPPCKLSDDDQLRIIVRTKATRFTKPVIFPQNDQLVAESFVDSSTMVKDGQSQPSSTSTVPENNSLLSDFLNIDDCLKNFSDYCFGDDIIDNRAILFDLDEESNVKSSHVIESPFDLAHREPNNFLLDLEDFLN